MAQELYGTTLFNDANIVSYYRFNNGALTTDSKGSNTLTDHGTVSYTASGKFGTAADFGSANSTKYFTLATTYGITNASIWSINFWVKFPYGEPSSLAQFFDLRPASNDCYFECRYSSGSIGFDAKGTTGSYSKSLADSIWHMITVSRNGTSFTIDLDITNIVSASPGSNTATGGFSLGNNMSATRYLNAQIDDLSIFVGRTLTSGDKTTLYTLSPGTAFPFAML